MQSYPLHTHNIVLFLVSSWKQMFGVHRVVSVADRAWENIELTFRSFGFDTPYLSLPPLGIAMMIPCTWGLSTITWDGVVINGEHLYIDHIYYMIHIWPFGLQCSEAMSIHARLVRFNPSIPHVQNCLTPDVCERRVYCTRSSRGASKRWTLATVHTQGEHFYLEI